LNLSFYYFQAIRKLLHLLKQKRVKHTVYGSRILDTEMGGGLIYEYLASDKPCMIARIGSVEMQAINEKYNVAFGLKKETSDVKIKTLYTNAGFFPCDKKALPHFEEVYRDACTDVDIMAVLNNRDEDYFAHSVSKKIKYITLRALEPYYTDVPWSRVLRGKKVLVVNPFADSISKQYQKRLLLFKDNPDILPEFELETMKAVQTIGGNTEGFADWFEALDYMKKQISKRDFDIAILGCGAYAFPLASYCKRIGKKAIILGGATQILFGVRGKRWDNIPFFKELFNEYWEYPSETEKPRGFELVENGCYW